MVLHSKSDCPPAASVLLLALCLAPALGAQVSSPRLNHVVTGVVFDSVAGAPLAGAAVQVASRDSLGRSFTVSTDSTGRFRVTDVPSGRFLVGFYHETLGALGLDAPFRALELAADSAVSVNLGIPSGRVVRALRCGDDSSAYSGGMLAGYLRDAATQAAITGAAVRVEWRAIVLDPGNFHTALQHATATIEADGSYLACRLPLDAPLDLVVTAPGHHELLGPLVVPTGGVARRDLHLVDSSAAHGPGAIRGRVVHEKGKAAKSGRALITALGRDVAVDDGVFVLGDIPLGSWVVEARVIGAEPRSVLVNATAGGIATTDIMVDDRAQRLDAVTVVGKPDRNVVQLQDVLRRRNIGVGTTFLPGSPALQSATFTSDVMKEARGFTYHGPDRIWGRLECKAVAVYVDDVRQPDGFAALDHVAPPAAVLAIETFPDIGLAPVRYRYDGPVYDDRGRAMRPCALVLVWTRH